MDNASIITNVISLLLSSLGVAYLTFWRFRQLRVDEFRQNIFILRDDLFDYAARGNISFNHPAYTSLRSMMNGYIRFSHLILMAHYISLVISTYVFNKEYSSPKFSEKWKDVTTDLDFETRQKMDEFRERISSEVFHYIFLSSYLKKLIVLMSGFGLFVFLKFLKMRKPILQKEFGYWAYEYTNQHSVKIRRSIDIFNGGAYSYGKSQSLLIKNPF